MGDELGKEDASYRPCVVIGEHIVKNTKVKYYTVVPLEETPHGEPYGVSILKADVPAILKDSTAMVSDIRTMHQDRFNRCLFELPACKAKEIYQNLIALLSKHT